MRIFCPNCKEIFSIDNASGSVDCPHCHQSVAVPESRVAPGVVLGDFLIEKPISAGGMGEVFVARQLSLDRQVALKVLLEKYSADSEYVQSLLHEARAAAKLNHPNIVQAYAVGEEEGIFYFAMEYIRGRTFKQILAEKKRLEPLEAAKVVLDVAKALDAAWREQKIVHQDIKPDNIMLDASGFAKLADLGLASRAGSTANSDGAEVMGTPQYISPEQLTGQPCDIRSDIYSLGATFYQFVTGRFPYPAKDTEEMGELHLRGNLTPPQEINPHIPDAVNDIIVKMMARDITKRYQTPAELILALEDFINQQISESTMKIKIFRRRKLTNAERRSLIRKTLLWSSITLLIVFLAVAVGGNIVGKYQTGPDLLQPAGNLIHQESVKLWTICRDWAVGLLPKRDPAKPVAPDTPPSDQPKSRPQLIDAAEAILARVKGGENPANLLPRYAGLLKSYPTPVTAEETRYLRELVAAFAAAEDAANFAPYREAARTRQDELVAAQKRAQLEAEQARQAEIARQKQLEAERQAEIARRKQLADQQATQYAESTLRRGEELLKTFSAALRANDAEMLNAALRTPLPMAPERHPKSDQAAAEYAQLQTQLAELWPKVQDFIRQLGNLESFRIMVSLPQVGMARATAATADGKVTFRSLDNQPVVIDRKQNPREVAKLLTTLGKTLKTADSGEIPANFYYHLWLGEWDQASAPQNFWSAYLKKLGSSKK